MGPMHHVIRDLVVRVEVGRQVCDPDDGTVLPSPQVDLGGLDDLPCESLSDAPSCQKLARVWWDLDPGTDLALCVSNFHVVSEGRSLWQGEGSI